MRAVEELLSPVSEQDPCGQDMSFSIQFDRIQEARREDDPQLEQGDWVREVKEADWSKVQQMAQALLIEQTKDLRVAGWLIESRIKLQGFQGMAGGLAFLAALCDRYWDGLHPRMEDDDIQARVGNLAWIINRARELARYVPLAHSDAGHYGIAYWDAAQQLAQAIRRSPDEASSLSAGRLTLEDFNQALADTPAAHYVQTLAGLDAARSALAELDRVLQERLGEEGPALSGLAAELDGNAELIQRFAAQAGVDLQPVQPVHPTVTQAVVRTEPTLTIPKERLAVSAHPVLISSRQQALEQLRQIAAFFRETEPHSPVAYMAQKAADWGEMPLHQWLEQVIKNPDTLASLQEQLGVAAGRASS